MFRDYIGMCLQKWLHKIATMDMGYSPRQAKEGTNFVVVTFAFKFHECHYTFEQEALWL